MTETLFAKRLTTQEGIFIDEKKKKTTELLSHVTECDTLSHASHHKALFIVTTPQRPSYTLVLMENHSFLNSRSLPRVLNPFMAAPAQAHRRISRQPER